MPQPEIERLGRDSSQGQIQAAISACVAAEIRDGKPRDQAVAMCYSMVREKTGKELSPEGGA